jgi:hypothetical protein
VFDVAVRNAVAKMASVKEARAGKGVVHVVSEAFE